MPKPTLTVADVLRWADAFHARHGRYPRQDDGPLPEADLTWSAVSQSLKRGYRGLPGGSSLAELLQAKRGVRNKKRLPKLTLTQILGWADRHHARTGDWPGHEGGAIPDTTGETWLAVETALRVGGRGLRGGSSLARLLAARRGVPNHMDRPPLTVERILGWADRHHAATGEWPTQKSGPVVGERDETWGAVDAALLTGRRGLPSGESIARLLAEHRGVRHPHDVPRLTVARILVWADAHKKRTGAWPVAASGLVVGGPGDTWAAVNAALEQGLRGLPGGDSLARLLARRRGKRHPSALPLLSLEDIGAWAVAYHRRCGRWPNRSSGAIPEAAGETWASVHKAFERGQRGLPRGMSLAQFLATRRESTG